VVRSVVKDDDIALVPVVVGGVEPGGWLEETYLAVVFGESGL